MSTNKPVTSNNDGFIKSSYSNDGPSCVEVSFKGAAVLIRDSKQNDEYTHAPDQQPTITYEAVSWPAFSNLALSTMSGQVGTLTVDLHQDGSCDLTGTNRSGEPVELQYTPQEWDAFIKGIADGEFVLR